MFDWCIALADYSILCWWNIVCVDNVYLLTRCHLILSFIRYVQWYGMNGIWLSRWIYQTPPKIYFWSKVRSSIGKHDVIMNFDLRKNKLRNLCFNFFSALLCGLNGYIAFIDENIAIETVQWQVSESGCYEYFDGTLPTDNTDMRMTKRSADALQGNCSDHMTGLAAATFGLFAKLTEQFEEETF